jgi:hypothetical protein
VGNQRLEAAARGLSGYGPKDAIAGFDSLQEFRVGLVRSSNLPSPRGRD